ncbi:hypothetical protein [Streptomyces sp. NPDC018352]|uniref:hypothetical protein n=1 Tax=Streptomyces sp. NPDC018352 TaxID=3157194 RepID=UPI0033FD1648
MDTHAGPEQTRNNAIASGPPIRQLFQDVIADRLPGPSSPQAAMLFDAEVDPYWDDWSFLGDFYNEILHQNTCRPATADGLALVAALAVDDWILARNRFRAVDLLFTAATVAERHLAETWPATPQHADPDSEARARNVVQVRAPDLLTRRSAECFAVRRALAGLAGVFPTDRTLPALAPRLQTPALLPYRRHRRGNHPGSCRGGRGLARQPTGQGARRIPGRVRRHGDRDGPLDPHRDR